MPVLPTPLATRWGWQLRAACRDAGAALFFAPPHERGRGPRQRREAAAKPLCARCPVRMRCLQHALGVGEEYGIWGGRTPEERLALRRSRQPTRTRS